MKMRSKYLKENVLLVVSPASISPKKYICYIENNLYEIESLSRFIGMVVFASLVSKSITRPIQRKVW